MHWAVNVDVPYDTIHRDVTDGRQTDSCIISVSVRMSRISFLCDGSLLDFFLTFTIDACVVQLPVCTATCGN